MLSSLPPSPKMWDCRDCKEELGNSRVLERELGVLHVISAPGRRQSLLGERERGCCFIFYYFCEVANSWVDGFQKKFATRANVLFTWRWFQTFLLSHASHVKTRFWGDSCVCALRFLIWNEDSWFQNSYPGIRLNFLHVKLRRRVPIIFLIL